MDIRKLAEAMNAHDANRIWDSIKDLFAPAAVEAQQVKAEAGLRILPVDENEFTQQDHEDYNEYLDAIYRAEELERLQRESDERIQDQ